MEDGSWKDRSEHDHGDAAVDACPRLEVGWEARPSVVLNQGCSGTESGRDASYWWFDQEERQQEGAAEAKIKGCGQDPG